MNLPGWLILAVSFGLLIIGTIKFVEWRAKKLYKILHPKEDDKE